MPKKRGGQSRQLKPRLHIFCEGAKTEPNYLKCYIEQSFPGTKLYAIEKTDKTTPVQLVEAAIAEKARNPEGDMFWTVYDREAENKYDNRLHAEARNKAKAKGIKIAFSNVCFEVWILLHFESTVAPYANYDELRKSSRLTKHIPGYDKGEKRSYSADEIKSARQNAKRLNRNTKRGADPSWRQPHHWNPYTDVYKLLDAMDKFGREYC